MEEKKQLGVYLPIDIHEAIKLAVYKRKKNKSTLVEESLREYLKEELRKIKEEKTE